MARKTASDPITHEMQQELLRTNQALKDAYARFDCVCDSDLIDACIFEINATTSSGASRPAAGRPWPPACPTPCRCRRRPPWPPPP